MCVHIQSENPSHALNDAANIIYLGKSGSVSRTCSFLPRKYSIISASAIFILLLPRRAAPRAFSPLKWEEGGIRPPPRKLTRFRHSERAPFPPNNDRCEISAVRGIQSPALLGTRAAPLVGYSLLPAREGGGTEIERERQEEKDRSKRDPRERILQRDARRRRSFYLHPPCSYPSPTSSPKSRVRLVDSLSLSARPQLRPSARRTFTSDKKQLLCALPPLVTPRFVCLLRCSAASPLERFPSLFRSRMLRTH